MKHIKLGDSTYIAVEVPEGYTMWEYNLKHLIRLDGKGKIQKRILLPDPQHINHKKTRIVCDM